MNIRSVGKEAVEQLPSRFGVVVVKVHRPQMVVKLRYEGWIEFELLDQDAGVVIPGEGGPHVHLGIYETNVLQRHDRVRDLFCPVFATRLNHSARKSVERDVENMSPLAGKPGGKPPKLVMMLEKQHFMPRLSEHVGA